MTNPTPAGLVPDDEQLLRDLEHFGYDSCCLEDMPIAEQHRLLTLHRHFADQKYNLSWYQGVGPCYDMLHDYLKGCSLQEAITAIKREFPSRQDLDAQWEEAQQ